MGCTEQRNNFLGGSGRVAVEGWQYIEVAGQLSPSPVHFVGVGAHCKSGKLRGLEENARDGIILSSGSPPGWEHNQLYGHHSITQHHSAHPPQWAPQHHFSQTTLLSGHFANRSPECRILCWVANMVNQIEPDQFVASVIFLSSMDKPAMN